MADTSTTLAPCPFCSAPASGYAIEPHKHSVPLKALVPGLPDHQGSYVIEGDCACGSGLIGETQAEVTERWNRRAPAPASGEPVAVPAGMEPVAWRLHPFDYGIGSAGVYALTQMFSLRETWIKKGWAPEPLYTAAQVQAMLAAAPRNAPLYDPDSVSFSASPGHSERNLNMVAPGGQALAPVDKSPEVQGSGPARVPLTDAQMAAGRESIFSTSNPYCPCDSKTFRKVAEWVERHHGITAAQPDPMERQHKRTTPCI